jgi:hypothetical protein
MFEEVLYVAQVAGDQIIHHDDLIPFADETVTEMRTQKAGPSGDQDSFFNHR